MPAMSGMPARTPGAPPPPPMVMMMAMMMANAAKNKGMFLSRVHT
jgi:hypothetical protein